MPKYRRYLLAIGFFLIIAGLILVSRLAEPVIFKLLSYPLHRMLTYTGARKLQILGTVLSTLGFGIVLFSWAYDRVGRTPVDFFHPMLSRWFLTEEELSDLRTAVNNPKNKYPASSWLARIHIFDWIAAAFFLVFAILFFLGRIQGNYPAVLLGGDAANIASFAAGWDHPSLFKGDALLGDLNNIRIYATVQIPLIRWLNGLVGDYGLAMTSMLAPHIFVFALGFYVLGCVVFKNRYWAFLFAVLNLLPYEINLQEDWGVFTDPVPRFTFQALLPFLLALIWIWRDQPRRWPLVMVFAGLLVYIHPVSTPAWMFAIWLAFWFFLPEDWSLVRKFGVMVGLGLISALVALPFVLNYLSHHVQGQSPNYEMVYYIIDNFFPKNLINVPAAMLDFLKRVRYLLPLSLAGLALTWFLRRSRRRDITLILAWCLGLLLMAVLIPWIEHEIERTLRMVPLETELTRAIRYFIPFMYLFLLWPLVEIFPRLKIPAARRLAPAFGGVIVVVFAILIPPYPHLFSRDLACFSQGKLICAGETNQDQAMNAIRSQVYPGAKIFTSSALESSGNYGMSIRYQGLHPVVFSYKDRGLLVYSNDKALTNWNEIYTQMSKLKKTRNLDRKFKNMLSLAQQLDAEYMLLDFPVSEIVLAKSGFEIVYSNPTFTLLNLTKSANMGN